MSYVALATNKFDEVVAFYGSGLAFPTVDAWDRPRGRGTRFDLGHGLRLEILDNTREPASLALGEAADRVHIVVEVDDIDAARSELAVEAPAPATTSWGARVSTVRDPDGVAVTFLQWNCADRVEP